MNGGVRHGRFCLQVRERKRGGRGEKAERKKKETRETEIERRGGR